MTTQQRVEAAEGIWILDTHASSVELHTKSIWGLVKVKGKFGLASGSGTVSDEGAVSGELVVDAASINTGNAKRDEHLRSADFLDTAHHPDITYRVHGISTAGNDQVYIRGSLTVRNTAGPLPFSASAKVDANTVTLTAEVPVNRSLFGVSFNKLCIMATDNKLLVKAVFHRGQGSCQA